MPRILIRQHQRAIHADTLALLRTRGFELIDVAAHGIASKHADLAIIHAVGSDNTPHTVGNAMQDIPVELPVVVLADTAPTPVGNRTVAGWLTMPFDGLEVVGVVRSVIAARAVPANVAALPEVSDQLQELQQERDTLKAADQKKDEFISYMSHELKNPMASIKGYSDLMRRRLNKTPDDPNRKGLEIISAQVGRMTLLLDQLLDFSRISMDRLQLDSRPVELGSLLERLIEETQPMTRQHVIQLVRTADRVMVLVDENRLRQALQYLLTNAIKFSPEPSTIVVTLSSDHKHEAQVAIGDKGIGIPIADQPHVFERFYRARNVGDQQSGLGLGLFLAHELVVRHEGRISIESQEREGSTFTVTLPLAHVESKR